MGTTTPTGKTDTTTGTAAPSKTVTTTPSAGIVQGPGNEKPKDCATGWEEAKPTRKLRDSAMTGRELDEKQQTKRKLEANSNKDIAKLEAYFGTSMEMTLKNLPTEGVHTPSPWPGPYWPTYQDSINVQWSQGEPSPAEKYAKAFGLDVKEFMDKVSKDNGVDSMSKRPKCTSDNDCASLNDGSGCGIRAGQSSGYCIPTWYGICHAWTPASMLEAEPNCPVTHNGVTFHPMDLKALISDIYDGSSISTVFTGSRFNGGSDSTDEYGRHSSAAYRDLNPAFFHITAANLLGKLNATFIADVTAGSEVWNQPVRGFKVYEQTEMSLEEAAQTFYGLEEYPWNAAAKSIVYVKSRLSWIFETYTDGGLVSSGQVDQFTTGAYYTYLLEMDDDGTIIGVDPTLPDITTISTVPVTYPDLLANLTTAPTEPLFTKVGTSVVSEPIPAADADQDGYVGKSTSTPVTVPSSKAGISTPSTVKSVTDCATGWEDSTTTQAKIDKKRRLEANTNKDIAKLEAYFGTKMEMTLKNLPTKGVHTPSPWPGPYWPTYQDSINVRWSQGEPSPAEKYAKAFGLDVKEFMDKV
ncbi:hypothetical protein PPTG_19674, partial [Phytophthora nicotianae INRA-310]